MICDVSVQGVEIRSTIEASDEALLENEIHAKGHRILVERNANLLFTDVPCSSLLGAYEQVSNSSIAVSAAVGKVMSVEMAELRFHIVNVTSGSFDISAVVLHRAPTMLREDPNWIIVPFRP